jgi:hypothetical protein
VGQVACREFSGVHRLPFFYCSRVRQLALSLVVARTTHMPSFERVPPLVKHLVPEVSTLRTAVCVMHPTAPKSSCTAEPPCVRAVHTLAGMIPLDSGGYELTTASKSAFWRVLWLGRIKHDGDI